MTKLPHRACLAAIAAFVLTACPVDRTDDVPLPSLAIHSGKPEPAVPVGPPARLDAAESSQPAKRFSVGMRAGRFWLIDPAGAPFFSLGVSGIRPQNFGVRPGSAYYDPIITRYGGDEARWIDATLDRLRDWNFNTIGSWSHAALRTAGMPYAVVLGLAPDVATEQKLDRVFSSGFAETVRANAMQAQQLADDPLLIGYFLDNELPWWGETGWRDDGRPTLLEKYARSELRDANKDALIAFFRERYETPQHFNAVWNTEILDFAELEQPTSLIARTRAQKQDARSWAGRVAERYFSVTTRAVRELDPEHLILGVRFAGEPIWEVLDACAQAVDVVSINHYSSSGDVDVSLLQNIFARSRKPLLISEYSFRAAENQSGNRNRRGPEVSVPTQRERVEFTERYVRQALDLPYVVGLHWFSWADQSPQGRFDLEDSNLGLVDIHDREYRALVRAHKRLNAGARKAHRHSGTAYPGAFISRAAPQLRRSAQTAGLPATRAFIDLARQVKISSWGHAGYGSLANASQTDDAIRVRYDSGAGWGAGVSLTTNAAAPLDLRGYDELVAEIQVPAGKRFYLYLTESGAGPPHREAKTGATGTDGESYALPMQLGTGSWATYRLPLDELAYRTEWGNQRGNATLDLQGLRSVDLHIAGGQGRGELGVRRIEFARTDPTPPRARADDSHRATQ